MNEHMVDVYRLELDRIGDQLNEQFRVLMSEGGCEMNERMERMEHMVAAYEDQLIEWVSKLNRSRAAAEIASGNGVVEVGVPGGTSGLIRHYFGASPWERRPANSRTGQTVGETVVCSSDFGNARRAETVVCPCDMCNANRTVEPGRPAAKVGPVCRCSKCNTVNEFAEPNQPDGSYICYGCR